MGKTKRGKGSKIMAVADGSGLPVAVCAASATPHESRLVEATLDARFTKERPERLIGDKAFDSDELDRDLKAKGVEMIAPHKENRRKAPTQDGRALRRYRRRWKVERLLAAELQAPDHKIRTLLGELPGFHPFVMHRDIAQEVFMR